MRNSITQSEAVIALHCSGGSAKQWRGLTQALGKNYQLHAPEHFGASSGRSWFPYRELSLADEAKASLKIIDKTDKKVHLVGHSYGGALALHIALARPERISSVTVYEPCAFHLLPQLGDFAAEELAEISAVASTIKHRTHVGDKWGAMQRFVDYWSAEGTWSEMKPEQQEGLMQWAPNAANAFGALFSEKASFQHYRNLKVPTLILQGEQSPEPVQVVSATLQRLLPDNQRKQMHGMGHMGPVTHAETINKLIAEFIERHTASITFNPVIRPRSKNYIAVAA